MEANEFVIKLKANGSVKDVSDLNAVYEEFITITKKLASKDRAAFSLNVLCILCRNLEKVSAWCKKIILKDLLILSIDCIRETRCLPKADKVKTLACIYHLHKYAVRQSSTAPPELLFKLSYMPFEADTDGLLKDYCKTYWNIVADRFIYIEKLKNSNKAIIKLLPKLLDDILSVIKIYDTVQYCSNILPFVIKKLYFLYIEYSKELNNAFLKMFEALPKNNDLNMFKNLQEKDSLDIYVKFIDCFCVISENSSKLFFKDCLLSNIIRIIISCMGHHPGIFHCLQTFYLNGFCSILTENSNIDYNITIFDNLKLSCETTEKLGYEKTLRVTYPYLNQFLKIYIEYVVLNKDTRQWKTIFPEDMQVKCLELVLLLIRKMVNTEQLLKCENCKVKSGLHDALRLSFLTKNFITISITEELDLQLILPIYYTIINEQVLILKELHNLGCVNYEKCLRKLQTDIHNTAILLNKCKHYDYSIKLFDLYLNEEIINMTTDVEKKNISRAFYNKSICELDYKMHDKSLDSAYLSLVFAYPEGLTVDKYMSLVMDIKSKALKINSNDDHEEKCKNTDDLQLMTVLSACKKKFDESNIENLKTYLCGLKFSKLLKHEFQMYSKLWPSIIPIGGIWRSLQDLSMQKHVNWVPMENEKDLTDVFNDVILNTPSYVRTIHSEHFENIVNELVKNLECAKNQTPTDKVVYASLLYLSSEYEMAKASEKYSWKTTEQTMDPDQFQSVRTVPLEFEALKRALQAAEIWTSIQQDIHKISMGVLRQSLAIAVVLQRQLSATFCRAAAVQLSHVLCKVALFADNRDVYVDLVSDILEYAHAPSPEFEAMIVTCAELIKTVEKNQIQRYIALLANIAVYYSRLNRHGDAARLMITAQSVAMHLLEKNDTKLDSIATGVLLSALGEVCRNHSGQSALSFASGLQRHYLSVSNTETNWIARRARSLALKRRSGEASVRAALVGRALLLRRRVRSSAGAGLRASAALGQAKLYALCTDTSSPDAVIKIDNRLKHILGLQPSNDIQPHLQIASCESKNMKLFTPKQEIETMRDCQMLKKIQTSPSMPCVSVPQYKHPEFLTHLDGCECYACQMPSCMILACQTSGLEAAMYFRCKEHEIAENYFSGVIDSFILVENNLKKYFKRLMVNKYEKYVVDLVKNWYEKELGTVQMEILIEASFFELSRGNFSKSDEYVVRLHEIMQDMNDVDPYVKNEVFNLMTASAYTRRVIKKPKDTGLEQEMENLKLTPSKEAVNPPKTPEFKPTKPLKMTDVKVVVKDEEIPNVKRKVIKLNLDEKSPEEKKSTERKTRRNQFKIPVPVTSKPLLENITPRPSRSKPCILVTQPSQELKSNEVATPASNTNKNEFFTPLDTPNEQFFTPMTSVKTYSKKIVKQTVIKNLESEFFSPKIVSNKENDKEALKPKSKLKKPDSLLKKTLRRATSPGKLEKVDKKKSTSRPRRSKQVVDENAK